MLPGGSSIVVSASVVLELKLYAGKAYNLLGSDLEEVVDELVQIYTTPVAVEQGMDTIMRVVITGCPAEVIEAFQCFEKYKGKHSTGTNKGEKRKFLKDQWTTVYRYRVVRIVESIRFAMFGALKKTNEELMKDLEKQQAVELAKKKKKINSGKSIDVNEDDDADDEPIDGEHNLNIVLMLIFYFH